jgi:hypothetical protein
MSERERQRERETENHCGSRERGMVDMFWTWTSGGHSWMTSVIIESVHWSHRRAMWLGWVGVNKFFTFYSIFAKIILCF